MTDQRRLPHASDRAPSRAAVPEAAAAMPATRSVFFRGVMAGLAAPTMLFTAPPTYSVYEAADGVPSAWRSVARHMSSAFPTRVR